jgi:hypothetical protein
VRESLIGGLQIAATDAQKSGDLNGEASTFVAVREVLQKGSKTWDEINAASGKISGLTDTAVKNVNAMDRQMRGMKSQAAFGVNRILEGGLQDLGQNDTAGPLGQLAQDKMRQLLLGTGVYSREADLDTLLQRLGQTGDTTGVVEDLRQRVATRAAYLKEDKPRNTYRSSGMGGMGGPLQQSYRAPNELELKNAAALERVAANLEALLEIMREQQRNPQPVSIANDQRPPTQPQPAPVPVR